MTQLETGRSRQLQTIDDRVFYRGSEKKKLFNPLTVFLLINSLLFTVAHSQPAPERIDTINIKAISEGNNLDVVILKKAGKSKKMPAILFVVGSGEQSTMKTNRELMHFFFENEFLTNDYAVVYFDKRGVGNSEGIWYETTFEQRALDAKNVALEIQNLDFIDSKRVFIIGHSQGGWIVQIALAMYPDIFAGGVSMAGPTFSVKRQLTNDYMSAFLCKGLEVNKALKKAKRKVSRDLFLVSLFGRKGNLKQLKIIKDFEPDAYLKAIKSPYLMLFAENDPLVSPKWSLDALDSIFPEGLPRNMDFYIAQGEEHSFKIAPKCHSGKWQDLNFSENTRGVIFDWTQRKAAPDQSSLQN